MKCSRCQHENLADAVFCQECGARLETACPGCGTANQLSLLGNYHYEIAQSESAIDHAERALAIARELGDPELEASVTFLLGQAHYGFGNYARAIELLVHNIAALDGQPP